MKTLICDCCSSNKINLPCLKESHELLKSTCLPVIRLTSRSSSMANSMAVYPTWHYLFQAVYPASKIKYYNKHPWIQPWPCGPTDKAWCHLTVDQGIPCQQVPGFYLSFYIYYSLPTISACMTVRGNPSSINPFPHSGFLMLESIISTIKLSSANYINTEYKMSPYSFS